MGVRVIVEKISDDDFDNDLVERLKCLGIVRLPAMIADNNKIFIGLDDIMKNFESNLHSHHNKNRLAVPGDGSPYSTGTGGGIQSYWEREMFAGRDNKGKAIPRKDGDDEANKSVGDDMARLASRYMAAREPKGNGQQQTRTPRRKRGKREDDDDNIDTSGYEEPNHGGGGDDSGESIADAYGDDMVKAWMLADGPTTDY